MLEQEGSKTDTRLLHVLQVIVGQGHFLTSIPVDNKYLLIGRCKSQNTVFFDFLTGLIAWPIIVVLVVRVQKDTFASPQVVIHTILDEAHRSDSIDHGLPQVLVLDQIVLVQKFVMSCQVIGLCIHLKIEQSLVFTDPLLLVLLHIFYVNF